MKKTMLLVAVGLMCLTACGQKKPHVGGPNGSGMAVDKSGDTTFVALKNETLDKFRQFTYEDAETGKTMEYNLFVPEGYDCEETANGRSDSEAENKSFPLVLFMADASTVGKEVTAPLTQGYGALEFASKRDQRLHPAFVLVPQYT